MHVPSLRSVILLLCALFAVTATAACGDDDDGPTRQFNEEPTISGDFTTPVAFPLDVARSDGRTVRLNAPPSRIVSVPSWATEMLLELDATAFVAAAGDSADLPPTATAIETRVPPQELTADRIASFNPDLVILDSDANGVLAALDARNVPVLFRRQEDIRTLFDIFGEMSILGQVTGRNQQALDAIGQLNERVKSIDDALRGVQSSQAPEVYHEASSDFRTVSSAGLIGDLYRILRAESIAAQSTEPQPQLSEATVIASMPDVIVVAHTAATADQVKARPGWAQVPAVVNNLVFTVDPALLRPVPRIVDALEQLAKSIYPTIIR